MGRIWVTDQNKNSPSIWMLDASIPGGAFHQYLTNAPNSTPVFVLSDATNHAWFTDTTANYLGEIDSSAGQIARYTLPTSNSGPAEIAFQNGTSYIWVTESFTNKIAKFDTGTHTFQEFTPSVSLISPVGIVVDANGSVWVSEHGGSSIAELFPQNSTLRKYPTSQPTNGFMTTAPATLSLDRLGRLWFVEHFGNKIGRLNPNDGAMDEFVIPTSGLAYSLRNALDSNGNFWFTEYSANQIGMIQWNATSPIAIHPVLSSILPGTVSAGQSVTSQLSLSNKLSTTITIKLDVTSTFTGNGQTSTSEVALSNSSLVLNPNQTKNITATITPDSSLQSGIYAAGLVATYDNISTIGDVFLHVQASFSISNFLLTYLPVIAVAAATVLILTNLMIRTRKRKTLRSATSKAKLPIGTLVVVTLTLVAFAIQVIPSSTAKCIGLPPPPNGGNGAPTGPDYFGLALDIGSLVFFAVVAFLLLKNWLRKKDTADDAKNAEEAGSPR